MIGAAADAAAAAHRALYYSAAELQPDETCSSQMPVVNPSNGSRKRCSVFQVTSQTQSRAPSESQPRPFTRSESGSPGLDLTVPHHFRQYCSLLQGEQATANVHTSPRGVDTAAPHSRSEHRAQQRVWSARGSLQRQASAFERSGSQFVRRALNGTRVDLARKPASIGTRDSSQPTPPGLPLPFMEHVQTSCGVRNAESAGMCLQSAGSDTFIYAAIYCCDGHSTCVPYL